MSRGKRKTTQLHDAACPPLIPAGIPTGYTEEEIVAASVAVTPVCGVYCCVRDGRVVYVGMSIDVARRIFEHRRRAKLEGGPIGFDRFAVFPCASKLDAERLEERLIKNLRPMDNRSMVGEERPALVERYLRPLTHEEAAEIAKKLDQPAPPPEELRRANAEILKKLGIKFRAR